LELHESSWGCTIAAVKKFVSCAGSNGASTKDPLRDRRTRFQTTPRLGRSAQNHSLEIVPSFLLLVLSFGARLFVNKMEFKKHFIFFF